MAGKKCSVCHGETFRRQNVLWPALINEWMLAPGEVDYINRQQGECCTQCGANLRSIALGDALRAALRTTLPLAQFCASPEAQRFDVLEINEAGTLHPVLALMPKHQFGAYPAIDMHALPFPHGAFDIVVHSDTLEHVANPVHALTECRRVLRKGGVLCFTVPIVVGRMTRGRAGLPLSFHGNPSATPEDYAVQTEYGANAWTQVVEAGFRDLHLFTVDYPAAVAIGAMKTD